MEPVRIEARDDNLIQVDCELRDRENVMEVPGALWREKDRCWTTRLSWAAMVQLRGVFGDRLVVGPKLIEAANVVFRNRIAPALEARELADYGDEMYELASVNGDELSPLQRSGGRFVEIALDALQCDPQGSGKTPQTIFALRAMQANGKIVWPALAVASNSGKYHWRNEFAKWWPDVGVAVVQGSAKKRREALASEYADVFVINWEGLRSHTRTAGYGNIRLTDKEKEPKELNTMGLRTVIADEVHRAVNPQAKQTRSLWYVGDHAAYRFGLTGTPIANSPADLWAVMRFIAPDEYPSKTKWLDRYGLLSFDLFGGLRVVGLKGETREELFRFLDARFIRRPKEIILPELEGKLPPEMRMIDLSPKQRKQYDNLREDMLAELDGGILLTKNPMVRMQRLRSLAGATGYLDDENNLQLKLPSAKIDEVKSIIEDSDDETQLAVYSESAKLAKLLHEVLEGNGIAAGLYTGDTSAEEREALRVAFQDRSNELRVLVMTYGVGSESIDLSQADCLVRMERSWSMVKDSQAEERPMRHGRIGPLRIYDIVALDTVDANVTAALAEKEGRLQEIVRDEETLRKWLSK